MPDRPLVPVPQVPSVTVRNPLDPMPTAPQAGVAAAAERSQGLRPAPQVPPIQGIPIKLDPS